MTEPQTFYGVNPIFRVHDLAVSVHYYTEKLGFKVNWSHPYVVSVTRGRTDLFLSVGDQGHAGAWVWIGVSDVEALHAEYQAAEQKSDILPPTTTGPSKCKSKTPTATSSASAPIQSPASPEALARHVRPHLDSRRPGKPDSSTRMRLTPD
jgi:hypothetical protein